METITVNVTGKVRREKLHGRDYFVAPMTMIVEGVLPGSDGPGLYPATENKAAADRWNGMPIMDGHPVRNGEHVSARRPDVFEAHGLGTVFEAKHDDGASKLTAEGWFDVERVRQVNPTVYNDLLNNRPFELSTGLYLKKELAKAGSVFNGKPYSWVARSHQPDHLAILTGQAGACSRNDGCGVCVNTTGAALTANEMSFASIANALNGLLRDKFGKPGVEWYGYVEDVFDAFFVYRSDGKLWRLSYSVDDDRVSLAGDPEEVSRVVEYKAVAGTVVGNLNPKESTMVPKVKIDKLLALNAGWSESHRGQLEKMDEPTFDLVIANVEKLTTNAGKPAPGAPAPSPGTPAPTPTSPTPAPTPPNPPTPAAPSGLTANCGGAAGTPAATLTPEAYLAAAPEPIRRILANGLQAFNAEQERLIGVITANSKRWTREHLATKDIGELEAIAEPYILAANAGVKPGNPAPPSYRGAAGGPVGNAATPTPVKPMERVTYNWGGQPAPAPSPANGAAAKN